GVGERRCVRAFCAALHVEEIVAQRGDAALSQALRDRRHGFVGHACPGAMREDEGGARVRRRQPQSGDCGLAVEPDLDRLCCHRQRVWTRAYRVGTGRISITSTESPGKVVKWGWPSNSFAAASCD